MKNYPYPNEIKKYLSNKYYKVYRLSVLYTCGLVLKIFERLGVLDLIHQKALSIANITQYVNVSNQASYSFQWMVDLLLENQVLILKSGKFEFNSEIKINQSNLKKEILELDSSYSYFIDYSDYVALEYPLFINGNKTGSEILFEPSKLFYWKYYFNNDYKGYSIFNLMSSYYLINKIINKDKITILELGAGTGGFLCVFLKLLKERNQNLNCEIQYVFTDLSPLLLKQAKELFKNTKNISFSFCKIDFNKNLVNQGIDSNSIDIVHAVNALHVAKDLSKTIDYIIEVLTKNGLFFITELIRNQNEPIFQEYFFIMLESFFSVETDDSSRPKIGFLNEELWLEIFHSKGLINISGYSNLLNQPEEIKFAFLCEGYKNGK